MKKKKKKSISTTLILGFIADIVAAWYVYDFLKAGEKFSGYVLVGVYGLIKFILILRSIKRRKRKKEFNVLFPEN
jgi:uncharacterized membrane protein YeaQ/YmgE (transglycosylase-associated protein family)